ncbi:WGR domain-containing protein [Streptomyces sp. NPDC004044]
MRRWEYVEGSASKFWETGADGAVVTVRYGRCGSDGRTQRKEYASADAAREQVRRTIGDTDAGVSRKFVGNPSLVGDRARSGRR